MTSGKRKNSFVPPSHPFAGSLSPDEKILWMDGHLRSGGGGITRSMALAGLIIAIALTGLTLNSPLLIFSLNCLCLAAVACVFFALQLIFTQPTQEKPRGVYALSNKHLFHRIGDNITRLSLEDVPQIDLVPGEGSEGTLLFGRRFPALPDIEDAAYVKTMIEQAKLHRLEENHDARKRKE